jgi:uncharacterized protein (TIGR02597 family)
MRPQLAFLGLLLIAVESPGADVSATPPAGYFKLTARGGSDTALSLPLVRRTGWMGKVSAVGAAQLTLTLAAPIVADQAAPSNEAWYYAEFVTGPLAGLAYPVVSNTDAGSFTLQTWGDDLTAHTLGAVAFGETGDIVRIRPGWRVVDVFGGTDDLVLAPAAETPANVYRSGDQVLLADNTTAGIGKKPSAILAYVDGQGWRMAGAEEPTDVAGQALPAWESFTVRRQAIAPAAITLIGYVPAKPRVLRIPAISAGGETDLAVAWMPAQESALEDSALAAVLIPATSPVEYHDLLVDFGVPVGGFSPHPERALTVIDAHWMEGDVNRDGFVLKPGVGYQLRLRGERPVRYWRQGASE